MSRVTSEHWPSLARTRRSDWRPRSSLAERTGLNDPQAALLIAGLVALGVGALAWYYLGPDLRRYVKIHNM